MKTKISMKPEICPRVVFITGLARAGKSMLAPLVSNLDRMEYFQVDPAVDHIPTLWLLDLMDGDTAAAMMRMTVDVRVYDRMIGRNLNTRLSDSTSIYNALDPSAVLRRSLDKDGPDAVARYNDAGITPCISTHMALPGAPLFFASSPDARIIQQVRHPIDVAESWRQRGWGERMGVDPTAFTFTVDTPFGATPWYAARIAEAYHAMSPADRVVWTVLELSQKNDDAVANLQDAERERVHTLTFESFATEPAAELERIATWLDLDIPSQIKTVMTKERVPRTLDLGARDDKLVALREVTSPPLIERLVDAARVYEERWGQSPDTGAETTE